MTLMNKVVEANTQKIIILFLSLFPTKPPPQTYSPRIGHYKKSRTLGTIIFVLVSLSIYLYLSMSILLWFYCTLVHILAWYFCTSQDPIHPACRLPFQNDHFGNSAMTSQLCQTSCVNGDSLKILVTAIFMWFYIFLNFHYLSFWSYKNLPRYIHRSSYSMFL